MQFAESFQILGAFHYHAAVDGIGVMFVLLTSVVSLLSVAFIVVRRLHESSVLAVMMGIQATITSQFVTVDLLWFTLMSCLEVVLVGYLTKRWPTFHDIQPTLARYLQFMVVGLLLMVFGTLVLGWNYADANAGRWSFSLYELAQLGFGKHEHGGDVGVFCPVLRTSGADSAVPVSWLATEFHVARQCGGCADLPAGAESGGLWVVALCVPDSAAMRCGNGIRWRRCLRQPGCFTRHFWRCANRPCANCWRLRSSAIPGF